MALEEVITHYYFMSGIKTFFPEDFYPLCVQMNKSYQSYFSKREKEVKDLPTKKVHSYNLDEVFNGKDFFLFLPGTYTFIKWE